MQSQFRGDLTVEGYFEQQVQVTARGSRIQPVGGDETTKRVTRKRPKIDPIACPWLATQFAMPVRDWNLPSCHKLLVAAAFIGLLVAGGSGALRAGEALMLESKIPLGDVRGRIDHLAVDLERQRLFIAELGNDSLGVVDLAGGKLFRRIDGLKKPTGVGYLPATDTIYVASGADGSVYRFGGNDLAPLGQTALGGDADNIRIDAPANQVVVGYGSGALALLDFVSGRKTGKIPLAGHPESFQLEKTGSRIFVNVPDGHEIAVVDRKAMRQVARWGLADAHSNFPLALDDTGGRLMVVYRKPPTLAVFETRRGEVVARLPTCGDADDIFFDSKRQRIYISCGEGFIAVIQRRGDAYEELARIPTVSGARTALFVPERDRLYLAVRASNGEPPAIWIFRPDP